jgi:uncharacterized protein YecA (UPF0149 family)
MARNVDPHTRLPTPAEFEPAGIPLELRCAACGKAKPYPVGRVIVDPEVMAEKTPGGIDDAFGFTGYFHCAYCQAGGPWELTPLSRLALLALLAEAVQSKGRHARIHFVKMVLFDGTASRWPTQAEAHLKNRIDADPDNYFLWSRLGNVYKSADAPGLAEDAFREALKRNEHDVESHHSLGEIYLQRGDDERAARHFHQVLLQARHAPARTDREFLRGLLEHTLGMLVRLHHDSGGKIPFYPEEAFEEGRQAAASATEPVVVRLESFDLSDEEDRGRLIEQWMTGRVPPKGPAKRLPDPSPPAPRRPGHPPLLSGRSAGAGPVQVGRNDPCPCGSGKKHKHCCLRR